MLPAPIQRAYQHLGRLAIVDANGEHSYSALMTSARRIAATLLEDAGDLQEQRIAFLLPRSADWVAALWGIWLAGAIAVPLPLHASASELQYIVDDTQASVLFGDEQTVSLLRPLSREHLRMRVVSVNDCSMISAKALPSLDESRAAMILYTSGATSRPKGVLTTHANISAQIECLVVAWRWSPVDRILLCLPLHHVHGIINVLCCALWAGAVCEMLPRFDAEAVWERLASGGLTLFMAVPTIYFRLIATWESANPENRRRWSAGASNLRLMVSGSAALPVSVLEWWREITGHTLLERYGMTEIGMALSNPYAGTRVPGSVGNPLPGVDVRLVNEVGAPVDDGVVGEIEVRGPGVFREYWRQPDATRVAFRDGWFRTGDTAVVENGVYRILGRSSIDILKSGGHKISALEIEEELRTHPAIRECAVVGIEDAEWGERVGVAIVLQKEARLTLEELCQWAKDQMSTFKVPARMIQLEDLPRNSMGKVMKPAVKLLLEKHHR